MNIKPFLKYYIGCRVIIDNDEEGNLIGGDFIPDDLTGEIYYTIETRDDGVRKVMPYNDSPGNRRCRIKLKVRRINDITDEEINKICSILIKKETVCYEINRNNENEFISAYFKKASCRSYNKYYDYIQMGIWIDKEITIRYIWEYVGKKGVGVTDEKLHNHNLITEYLISRRFWLFGHDAWDEGLIIDENTK